MKSVVMGTQWIRGDQLAAEQAEDRDILLANILDLCFKEKVIFVKVSTGRDGKH